MTSFLWGARDQSQVLMSVPQTQCVSVTFPPLLLFTEVCMCFRSTRRLGRFQFREQASWKVSTEDSNSTRQLPSTARRKTQFCFIAEETGWRDWGPTGPMVPECTHCKGSLAPRVKPPCAGASAGIYDLKRRGTRPCARLSMGLSI